MAEADPNLQLNVDPAVAAKQAQAQAQALANRFVQENAQATMQHQFPVGSGLEHAMEAPPGAAAAAAAAAGGGGGGGGAGVVAPPAVAPKAYDEDVSNKRKYGETGVDGVENGEGPMRKRMYSGSDDAANVAAVAGFSDYVGVNEPPTGPPGAAPITDPSVVAPGLDPSASVVGGPVAVAPGVGGDITDTVTCPSMLVGRLIGRSGATIKQLQHDTNTKIQIDHQASGDMKKVSITGKSVESLEQAKQMIKGILESDGPTSVPGEVSQTVDCLPGIVGRVIGRGGETIKALQSASGANIVVDQNFPQGVPRKVKITGQPDAVDRAVKMVTELINGEPGSAQKVIQKYGVGLTKVLECPKAMVGRVIGKGGETIKMLQKETGAAVQIDQNVEPCKVTISGPPMKVQAAADMVQEIINGGNPLSQMGHYKYGPPRGPRGQPHSGYPPQYTPYQYQPPPAGHYGGYSSYPPPAAPNPYGYYNAPGYTPQPYPPTQAPAPTPAPSYGAYPGYGQSDPYGSQAYGAAGYGQPASTAASTAQPSGQASATQPGMTESVWQELHDPEGRPYYYNTQTGVSQWEKPADFQ